MAGWSAICCAVDFSDASRFAMEEAADLARAFEAQLVLVHVHETPVFGGSERERPPTPLGLEAVDLERDICAWRCEAQKRAGSTIRSFVLAGDPVHEIVRFAEESRADVLVVGKKGRTGLERVVLGSVAEKLVRSAPCPVLVVREKELVAYRAVPDEPAATARWP